MLAGDLGFECAKSRLGPAAPRATAALYSRQARTASSVPARCRERGGRVNDQRRWGRCHSRFVADSVSRLHPSWPSSREERGQPAGNPAALATVPSIQTASPPSPCTNASSAGAGSIQAPQPARVGIKQYPLDRDRGATCSPPVRFRTSDLFFISPKAVPISEGLHQWEEIMKGDPRNAPSSGGHEARIAHFHRRLS